MPKNENQVRPLLDLPREDRVACWKEIFTGEPPEKLTGTVVAKGVAKYADAHKLPIGGNRKVTKRGKETAVAALERLRTAVETLPQADEIEKLLVKVEGLIA